MAKTIVPILTSAAALAFWFITAAYTPAIKALGISIPITNEYTPTNVDGIWANVTIEKVSIDSAKSVLVSPIATRFFGE